MTGFDAAAVQYDAQFTHSLIGKAQRKRVYRTMADILHKTQPKKILEINCGTGEDALWLAGRNAEVVATDISERMIEIAKRKSTAQNPIFLQTDINDLPQHFTGQQFDLIFSNFGGLNCLSPVRLELFFKNTVDLLSTNGALALVVMPRNTKWEQLYFFAKGNFRNVFRRKKNSAVVNVDGQNVITHYYNPDEIVDMANGYFEAKKIRPIGFFVPPSYLEPFFGKHQKMLSVLDTLESRIANWHMLARHADHYLIYLQKK